MYLNLSTRAKECKNVEYNYKKNQNKNDKYFNKQTKYVFITTYLWSEVENVYDWKVGTCYE